jgi:hypothetical protein
MGSSGFGNYSEGAPPLTVLSKQSTPKVQNIPIPNTVQADAEREREREA